MYCSRCGNGLPDGTAFCTNCGEKVQGIIANNYGWDFEKDSLVRIANKMVDEFVGTPIIPTGDLSFEFINDVANYNPLYTLEILRKQIINTLCERTQYRYDESYFEEVLTQTYYRKIRFHQTRILNVLVENFKGEIDYLSGQYDTYLDLRPKETKLFYYAHSIFYISNILGNIDGLFFSRLCLQGLKLLYCVRNKELQQFGMGLPETGQMLELTSFFRDRQLYQSMLDAIEKQIMEKGDDTARKKLKQIKANENSENKKQKTKKVLNVLFKIIFLLSIPLFFILISSSSYVDSTLMESWIPLVSCIVLWLVALIFTIRIRNAVGVFFIDLAVVLAFYPLCLLIDLLVEAVIILIALLILAFVGFIHGDKV